MSEHTDPFSQTYTWINARLIADGYNAECVKWLCEKHDRHCVHLGSDHAVHECIWCIK